MVKVVEKEITKRNVTEKMKLMNIVTEEVTVKHPDYRLEGLS